MATDLSKYRQPSLDLILSDTDSLRVTAPSLALVQELRESLPQLREVLEKEDDETRTAVYDLAARLMSFNKEGKTITADDLEYKYELDEIALAVFFSDYVDFIDGLKKAKN